MVSRVRILARARRVAWRLRPPVLALGGGGARGFAHLGVLEVLETNGLHPRAIAGTSMGAVVGAMVLGHGSAAAAIARWRAALERDLVPSVRNLRAVPDAGRHEHPLVQVARRIRNRLVVSFVMNRPTMLDDRPLNDALTFLLPDTAIESLPRPFVVVATDLESGAEVRIDRGPVLAAIRASSAIPGLLPATRVDDRLLVDGGVVAEVPVEAARSLGRPVVAIEVSMKLPPLHDDRLVLDTMMRTQTMTSRLLRDYQLSRVDHVLRPKVGHAAWADWDRFEELVEAGRRAARDWLALTDADAGSQPPNVATPSQQPDA